MIRRFSVAALALAASVSVTACTSTSELQTQSLAQWKAYCAAKGKQFLWKDTNTETGMVMNSVQVEGKCVGPGDRGYRAPEPADEEP